MQIKSGQIVALTTGEYSDYCLNDHMRCMRDFDSDAERAHFLESSPEVAARRAKYVKRIAPNQTQVTGIVWTGDMFIAWLQREGFLEPLENEVVELWVPGGSYD